VPSASIAAPTAPAASPAADAINLAARLLARHRYDTNVMFSASNALIFRGPVGLHRLDTTTGAERVLWRDDDPQWDIPYRSAHLFLLREEEPFRVQLVDADTQTVRALPVGAGAFAFSHDEARLLWQPQEGAASLFDTASLRILHTFPVSSRTSREPPLLSLDGHYAYVRGNLYEIETDRVIWSSQGVSSRVSFLRVAGEPVLLASSAKKLELVQLPSGTVHVANADCIDVSSSKSESRNATTFARNCPRGKLVVDLVALTRSSAPLLQPTRIRNGSTPSANAAEPMPDVLTTSADGTRRIEKQTGICSLVDGKEVHVIAGGCDQPVLSADGRFLASVMDEALTVQRVPELQTIYQTDPEHELASAPPPEAKLEDGARIHVVTPSQNETGTLLHDFWIERTASVLLGGETNAAAPVEHSEHDGNARPLVASFDGVDIRLDGTVGDMLLWTFSDSGSGSPLMTLVVAPEFGIFESASHRVQIVGNREKAVSWLRCLGSDGVLRPFDTCAKSVSAALY
jgi:hypothetical protein